MGHTIKAFWNPSMMTHWAAISLVALCGLSLGAATMVRIAWPAYVTAALFVPVVLLISGSWLSNDCFNEYFELNGWGQHDPLILSFFASMAVFCAGFVHACRTLSRGARAHSGD